MKFLILIALSFTLTNCIQLPEYKKNFVNDEEMSIGLNPSESLSENPITYREGSQGGNKGKSGGGCGCN